jgi:hypothetical protein
MKKVHKTDWLDYAIVPKFGFVSRPGIPSLQLNNGELAIPVVLGKQMFVYVPLTLGGTYVYATETTGDSDERP